MSRRVAAAVALALAMALGYWVWPTPYRYLPSPRREILAVRVNRFTSEAQYLTAAGWHRAAPARRSNDPFGLFRDSTR